MLILSYISDYYLKAIISSQMEIVACSTEVSLTLANTDIQKFIYKVNCVASHGDSPETKHRVKSLQAARFIKSKKAE